MKPENIKDDKNVVQTPVTDDKNVVQTPVTDDKNIVQELPKQEVAAV
jgi:hypothetical protein